MVNNDYAFFYSPLNSVPRCFGCFVGQASNWKAAYQVHPPSFPFPYIMGTGNLIRFEPCYDHRGRFSMDHFFRKKHSRRLRDAIIIPEIIHMEALS